MIIETPEQPPKKVKRQLESKLQSECFIWCWNEHPETRGLLFHVENERTHSSIVDGARRRSMGLVPGVSDFVLLIARGQYHGLLIEMKTETGYQSKVQRAWQDLVEKQNYKYEVCRSFEQFKQIINDYLTIKH